MDMDNENFFDEISSFIPQSGEYNLADLDEIIRTTDSHLDASLDINSFSNTFEQIDFDTKFIESNELDFNVKNSLQQITSSLQPHEFCAENKKHINYDNDGSFNFSAFPSPATSHSVGFSPSPIRTSDRTSSPISLDGDHFNPDDFINFFSDDSMNKNCLTRDTNMKLNENCRNTPSPTDSFSSSSGSSTSGVQSDASSFNYLLQNDSSTIKHEADDDLSEFITFKNEKFEQGKNANEYVKQQPEQSDVKGYELSKDGHMLLTTTCATSLLPVAIPVLPMSATPSVQPLNLAQGTIIPVQTRNNNPVINLKGPSAFKSENKPCSNKTAKLVTAASNCANETTTKLTSAINPKPKTIYLSSNDFKTLMQKMNANGKKITGNNVQTPKILMKTANGKVIAANKITNVTRNISTPSTLPTVASIKSSLKTATSPQQCISKVVNASEPIMLPQQQSRTYSKVRSSAATFPPRAALSHLKNRSDCSMLKDLHDNKILKKQIRMLKNRESASLSRKKKKEYVERLENRISNLEKENYTLKGENSSLRSQLMAFAQTCSCKHGNVSEFILNTLNMDGKSDEAVLNFMNNGKGHTGSCNSANRNNLGTAAKSTTHIKIAPKPENAGPFVNKGFKQRMTAASVKKNIAVLFAMAFMITLNVGNFQNYLNKSALENAIETSAPGANEEPVGQTGRRLLWVPNEHELHEQTNRTKRDTEMFNMPPPPLHFLRPINRTSTDKTNTTTAKDGDLASKRLSNTATYPNSTLENMRLARNLHKWIGGNGYLNLTDTGVGIDLENVDHFKFASGSYMDYDLPLQAPIGAKQKRKLILDSQMQEKHVKVDVGGVRHSLDIYKPRISEEYLRLFNGIKRQNDTFYVLSFNMDHILLPASAYNKSSRPKMSLLLPAGDPSHNGDVVLMQIDCEVINTTELEIKSDMIPKKLRPSKYSANVRVNPNDVANNETHGPGVVTFERPSDVPIKKDEWKEKRTPRTYFMMGPKNQATAQSAEGTYVMKKKPTIVKLNANDSVIGSGILNVRNSSLFSRMRETVVSQTNGFVPVTNVKK